MLLFNWYWLIFPHDISVTNMAVTCVITAYATRQNSQIICQRVYKRCWMVNKAKRGDKNYSRHETSQQYPDCHTQFQALQCAHSRQVQHNTIHQFTADRTANTKRGNQYRLQFQAFYVMFRSRYSSGHADQLVLSTVLGTLDSGPSALPGVTEYELLLSRWL